MVAGVAVALLLATTMPVEANWLARGSAVLGVGYSLKRNLGEGIDLMGEALDAAMHGDVDRMLEIGEEIEALPGRLVRDAFPVFKLGAGVRDTAVSAGEKLKSVAGHIPRLRSEALGSMESSRERLQSVTRKVRRYYGDADKGGADPRMALAVEAEERALFDATAGIPDKPVLAAAPTGDADSEAGASRALGWDDLVGSEAESQAVEGVPPGPDPWAADEGGSQSIAWDEEPASGAMEAARVEVVNTPDAEDVDEDGDDYTHALNALLSDDPVAAEEASVREEQVTREPDEATAEVMPAAGRRAETATSKSGEDAQIQQTRPPMSSQQSDSGSTVSAVKGLCENAKRRAEEAIARIDQRARSVPQGGAEAICAQINRFDVVIRVHQDCLADTNFRVAEREAMRAQLVILKKSRSSLKETFDGVAARVRCECWTNMC